MEEIENMQNAETEKPKGKKELFMERFAQNYPDIPAEDEEEFYGKSTRNLTDLTEPTKRSVNLGNCCPKTREVPVS